jgi:hypothetical protein
MTRARIRLHPIVSAGVGLLVVVLWSSDGRADRMKPCGPAVDTWTTAASKELGFVIKPLACAEQMAKVQLIPSGADVLDVELASSAGSSFRKVGPYRVSPIVQLADIRQMPAAQRRAFDLFIDWLTKNTRQISIEQEQHSMRTVNAELPRMHAIPGWTRAIGWVTWLALILAGFLGERAASRGSARDSAETPAVTSRRAHLRAIVLWPFAVFVVVLLLGMPQGLVEQPIHVDAARDMLIARELARGDPTSLGAISTSGFFHGFVWQRWLAPWVGEPALSRWISMGILVMFAGAAAAFFHVIRARLGVATAVVGSSIYLVFALNRDLFYPLWHPTLVPEAVVLIVLAMFLLATRFRNKTWWMVAACVAFSVATQVHLQLLLLAPAVAYLMFRCGRRWVGVLMVPVTLFLSWSALSRDSLGANWILLTQGREFAKHFAWPAWENLSIALIYLFVVVVHEVAMRRTGQGREDFSRFCKLALLFGVLTLIPIGALGQESARYLKPLLPFCLVLLCDGVNSALVGRPRRVRAGVIALSVVWSVWSSVSERISWRVQDWGLTPSELHAVADALSRHGLDAAAAYQLVSPSAELQPSFDAGVWIASECRANQQMARAESAVRYLLLASPEGTHHPIQLGSQRYVSLPGNGRSLLLVPYEPYVRLHEVDVCSEATEREGACGPVSMAFLEEGSLGRCYRRGWPHAATDVLRDEQNVQVLRFDVRVPGNGIPKTLLFPAVRPECRGKVVRVDGIDHRPLLDGHGLQVLPRSAEQHGSIFVSWDWSRCFAGPAYPLPVLEFDEALYQEIYAQK